MTANANIAAHLPAVARRHAGRRAVVDPRTGESLTFAELESQTNRLACSLARSGITAGQRVALMVPPGVPFFAYTFALFKLGTVPVLIDPGMGLRGLGRCIAESAPQVMVGSAKAHAARLVFGWARQTIKKCVWVGRRIPAPQDEPDSAVVAERQPEDVAAILFTSGSTGPAKGAVYTHGMFQEQVRLLRECFGIGDDEIDLCTFPLFALFAPALGMTSVVPDMNPTRPADADPRNLVRAIHRYGVTNLFGSPALVNVLGKHCSVDGVELPTVRRIISAGAAVQFLNVARMASALSPGRQVYTPYGATESLPITNIGSRELSDESCLDAPLDAGVCVGRPVPGIDLRIIPISDGPLTAVPAAMPVRRVGEVTVRGALVSRQYWNRPDSDALHKVKDGNSVWHRTGDVGYIDERGRLWYCGRKLQRVVTDDGTLFTECCEGVFNAHKWVYRTALVGVPLGGLVRPVVCVELESRRLNVFRADIEADLLQVAREFESTRHIRNVLFHPGFPVDIRHNAKINREKLAAWAARRLR